MFDEPNENESPTEPTLNPADRAKEKAEEFRVHAQFAAVFEGCRKFDAQIVIGLDLELAWEMQRSIGRLEKSKSADSPVLPEASAVDAAALLNLPNARGRSTNDYHINRRPGEVMMVRWLAGDQVESFYERMQAHFDAAMTDFREEERQTQEWKQDPKTLAYLDALDKIEMKMAERYLREVIRARNIFVLSTQTADEMDILHLCDYVMGVPAAEIVGRKAAPLSEPTERDRAWYFKLFCLRGINGGVEQMCYFTYLQKSDDALDSDS